MRFDLKDEGSAGPYAAFADGREAQTLAGGSRLRRSLRLGIRVGSILLLPLVAFALIHHDLYRAESRIAVDPIVAQVSTGQAGESGNSETAAWFEEQEQVLRSPETLALALNRLPGGHWRVKDEDAVVAIARLSRAVQLAPVPSAPGHQFSVAIDGADQTDDARVVNAVTQAFLERSQRDAGSRASMIRLSAELDRQQKAIIAEDSELAKLRTSDSTVIDPADPLGQQRTGFLIGDIENSKAALSTAEQTLSARRSETAAVARLTAATTTYPVPVTIRGSRVLLLAFPLSLLAGFVTFLVSFQMSKAQTSNGVPVDAGERGRPAAPSDTTYPAYDFTDALARVLAASLASRLSPTQGAGDLHDTNPIQPGPEPIVPYARPFSRARRMVEAVSEEMPEQKRSNFGLAKGEHLVQEGAVQRLAKPVERPDVPFEQVDQEVREGDFSHDIHNLEARMETPETPHTVAEQFSSSSETPAETVMAEAQSTVADTGSGSRFRAAPQAGEEERQQSDAGRLSTEPISVGSSLEEEYYEEPRRNWFQRLFSKKSPRYEEFDDFEDETDPATARRLKSIPTADHFVAMEPGFAFAPFQREEIKVTESSFLEFVRENIADTEPEQISDSIPAGPTINVSPASRPVVRPILITGEAVPSLVSLPVPPPQRPLTYQELARVAEERLAPEPITASEDDVLTEPEFQPADETLEAGNEAALAEHAAAREEVVRGDVERESAAVFADSEFLETQVEAEPPTPAMISEEIPDATTSIEAGESSSAAALPESSKPVFTEQSIAVLSGVGFVLKTVPLLAAGAPAEEETKVLKPEERIHLEVAAPEILRPVPVVPAYRKGFGRWAAHDEADNAFLAHLDDRTSGPEPSSRKHAEKAAEVGISNESPTESASPTQGQVEEDRVRAGLGRNWKLLSHFNRPLAEGEPTSHTSD